MDFDQISPDEATDTGPSGVLHTVYLALGSNLGNRHEHLLTALEQLRAIVALQAISSIYETEPVGYLDQPHFLNLVCAGKTRLSPQELLQASKGIEATLGRQPSFRNAPRPIDIDILLYDDVQIQQANLVVPHPRMKERAFVLVPLAEIAPEYVIPGSEQTVQELANAISHDGVKQYTN
ncbi:MAG TPA: 2-amino-4-hydroxy-6-hydroxymethyldihydropteridine diphosphokinase [Ktedonosporobacter sp.]|nr:2-amino-4-hydroxy-6-hydroxymethyldihydropteridine diphosphokinase [Ktedonosporobacter sp.]